MEEMNRWVANPEAVCLVRARRTPMHDTMSTTSGWYGGDALLCWRRGARGDVRPGGQPTAAVGSASHASSPTPTSRVRRSCSVRCGVIVKVASHQR